SGWYATGSGRAERRGRFWRCAPGQKPGHIDVIGNVIWPLWLGPILMAANPRRGLPPGPRPRRSALGAGRSGRGGHSEDNLAYPNPCQFDILLFGPSILHTGRHYPDDLSDDGVIYHYPTTKRPAGRDAAEVQATKNAAALSLPIFAILPGTR